MAFIKNDVTEDELERLFDKNDTRGFVNKEENGDNNEDELISPELDIKKDTESISVKTKDYQKQDTHTITKAEEKRKEEKLLQSSSDELLKLTGNVTKNVFSEIAKVRQKAQLEAYKQAQAKIPVVQPDAKIKLRGNEDQCNFHVYVPKQMIDSDHMMTCCKYCSEFKVFEMSQWLKYQLENKEFI